MMLARAKLATPAPTNSSLAFILSQSNQSYTSGVVIVSRTANPLKCTRRVTLILVLARIITACGAHLVESEEERNEAEQITDSFEPSREGEGVEADRSEGKGGMRAAKALKTGPNMKLDTQRCSSWQSIRYAARVAPQE